jgi:hypothetical protein
MTLSKTKTPKLPVPSEASVQAGCLELLRLRGVQAWRNNSRVFFVPGKGGKSRPMRAGFGNGSADIVGLLPGSGRFLAVECKRPGEKPTKDQVAWLNGVNDTGGFACWVSTIAGLEGILELLSPPGRTTNHVHDDGDQVFNYRKGQDIEGGDAA